MPGHWIQGSGALLSCEMWQAPPPEWSWIVQAACSPCLPATQPDPLPTPSEPVPAPARPPLCAAAAADIRESIEQLKYYRKSIFKKWAGMDLPRRR